jgi:hypothetical protein
LFHASLNYLGDPLQWLRIAAINGVKDPFLTTLTVLRIPTMPVGDGGRF